MNYKIGDKVEHCSEKEWGTGTILKAVETPHSDDVYLVSWPKLEHSWFFGKGLIKVCKTKKSSSELEEVKQMVKALESKLDTMYLLLRRIEDKNEV